MMARQADGQMSIKDDAELKVILALLLKLRNMLMLFMSEVGILSQWGGNGMALVRVVQASLLASTLVDLDLLLMM